MRRVIFYLYAVLVVSGPGASWVALRAGSPSLVMQSAPEPAAHSSLADIQHYISDAWNALTRSPERCESYRDPKTGSDRLLYLPADFAEPESLRAIAARCGVQVTRLPAGIEQHGELDLQRIPAEGLLYLPNPYVVPGGRFNEMYGWDSYFIELGLLRDGQTSMAKGMVENFFFEIDHYGATLNANRTYYLARSQPPFLTSMILAVYDAEKAAGRPDRAWLERAYGYAVRDHDEWVRDDHLAGDTGLSRYFDHDQGPVPEILDDPGEYYRDVVAFRLADGGVGDPHLVPVNDPNRLPASIVGPVFPVLGSPAAREDGNVSTPYVALAADYYQGDRAMRESGFDVSFRFGPYGAETHHYAPVCLNSLLYKAETDLAEMSDLLGRPRDATAWHDEAAARRANVNSYLWNSARGLFFDYDFLLRHRSTYDYATTFYPLWAGLASPEQARAVANNLALFEQPGGLTMSREESGAQWDYPYGWAPVEFLALEGLRRYGYANQADRVAFNFLSMVLDDFRRTGMIREKYNVITRSSETNIEAGYRQNVVGFGWTNAVFLEFLHSLPPASVAKLQGG